MHQSKNETFNTVYSYVIIHFDVVAKREDSRLRRNDIGLQGTGPGK